MSGFRFVAMLCAGVASASLANPVFAQSATLAGTDAAESDSGLADIVVTAQRQSQSMQKVPIAISAITGDSLASRQIVDTLQIAAAVPNLVLTQNGYSVTPFIRGVGSNQGGPADEPSVATYIDGVYIPSPAGNIFRLNNVERIEVLKGPQGTLFGRNATAGVIQIITRDPSHEPTANGTISYGSYDTVEGTAYASTGLGQNLAIDTSLVYAANYRGFGYDIARKTRVMKRKELGIRSKLLWTPTDSTEVRLAGGYSRLRSSGSDYQSVRGVRNISGQPSTLGPRITNTDYANSNNNRVYDLSLNIRQDLGFAKLVSITGYRNVDGLAKLDQDATPIPAVRANINQTAKSYSQELQLLSGDGSSINWLLGGYYFHGRAGYDPLQVNVTTNFFSTTTTNSLAGFGQATIPITDSTNITGGLRYTSERQRLHFQLNTNPQIRKRNSVDKLTWRLSVDHEIAPDILGYVSYNRGLKSGGFGLTNGIGYEPEVLDAYEAGLKTQLFDRRIRLNVAAFYYDYSNIQVSFIANGVITTQNAAAARVYGLDAELTFRMSPTLTLSTGFGYTNARYKDFPNAPLFSSNAGPATQGDASGNVLTGAPPITANAAIDYRIPTSIGTIGANFQISYRDRVYVGPDNRLSLPEYAVANATVTWTSLEDRFSLSVWARNLFNKDYLINRTQQANLGAIQVWGNPRVVGATLGVKL